MQENILVYPTSLVPPYTSTFTPDEDAIAQVLNAIEDFGNFVPRDSAEKDTSYVQPIGYSLVKRGTKYLTYRRTSSSGESRLSGKLSCGIGGHTNDQDDSGVGLVDAFLCAADRELQEELNINQKEPLTQELLGVIYDPSTPVGVVHIGIVALFQISEGTEVTSSDPSIANIKWMDRYEILTDDTLENWSRIVLTNLSN